MDKAEEIVKYICSDETDGIIKKIATSMFKESVRSSMKEHEEKYHKDDVIYDAFSHLPKDEIQRLKNISILEQADAQAYKERFKGNCFWEDPIKAENVRLKEEIEDLKAQINTIRELNHFENMAKVIIEDLKKNPIDLEG